MSTRSEPRRIEPADVIQFAQIPERPDWYVLGSFERRVTLYSQQVRALNLIYSLFAQGKLQKNDAIAIIGAGAAGLTAAAAAAKKGCRVEVFESSSRPLPLQHGSLHRWVHPHIYDWPRLGSDNPNAGLPLLNWTADSAGAVARQIINEWRNLASVKGKKIKERYSVSDIELFPFRAGRTKISYNQIGHREGQFDVVIIAVGFGSEEGHPHFPGIPYWREDDLHQPMPVINGRPTEILVSGSGDGGLVDLLRATLEDFQHDKIVKAFLSGGDIKRLEDRLLEIEAEATTRNDGEEWMYDQYKQLQLPKSVAKVIRESVRKDTKVTLNSPTAPIGLNSSVLHRFLASQLFAHGVGYQYGKISEIKECERNQFEVQFDCGNGKTVLKTFNRIVIRHGPTSAFSASFGSLEGLCEPLKIKANLDQVRYPMWAKGFYDGEEPQRKSPADVPTSGFSMSSGGYKTDGNAVATTTDLSAFEGDLNLDSMSREQMLYFRSELQRRLGLDEPPPIMRTEE